MQNYGDRDEGAAAGKHNSNKDAGVDDCLFDVAFARVVDFVVLVGRYLHCEQGCRRHGHTRKRRTIALLPDREPATAQAWLAAQPQIEVVTRDRGGGYALAAARGCRVLCRSPTAGI